MPLTDVPLPQDAAPLPPEITRLLNEADRRIERFLIEQCIPGFVPSDFPLVYTALRAVAAAGLAPGPLFCEWGSGFGVVASMAAMLGYQSCGLETQSALVDASRRLAEDFGVHVDFVHGSFVPADCDAVTDNVDGVAWLDATTDSAHEELGLEPGDFDLIYAFPWPGEEHVIERLFARTAAVGSLLLTYHGMNEMKLRRKVASHKPRSHRDRRRLRA